MFKKIFNVNLEKKNSPSNSILLDIYQELNQKIFPLCFKGNVNKNLEPELFGRKNKKYVDEFNKNIKNSCWSS